MEDTFSTTSGHYHYIIMAYGLINAPVYFQAFMNDVLRDMINCFTIVYLNDIFFYSRRKKEHVSRDPNSTGRNSPFSVITSDRGGEHGV